MSQKVRDWMSNSVVLVPKEITARQGMTLMRRRGIHSLVVDLCNEDERRYGIVASSDIRQTIVVKDCDPAEITVAEIMTSPITCAAPDWSLRQASSKMLEVGVRHLPVEDKSGSLVGMISTTDIFVAVEEAGWSSNL